MGTERGRSGAASDPGLAGGDTRRGEQPQRQLHRRRDEEVVEPPAARDLAVQVRDPVPVPAALPLFAAGLSAMGFMGWRRKRRAA